MRMGQGVRAGLGHGGITCVLQTQFSSYIYSTSDFILSRANIFIYASDGDANSKLMSPGLTGFKFVVKFRTIQTQWRYLMQ